VVDVRGSMSAWKRARYRLEELACRLLAWAIPRLPRRVCLGLADTLAALAYRFDRRGRTVAESNVACVFGDSLDARETAKIVRGSYRNFARTMLDLFWAARLDAGNWQQWMQVEGFDALRERLSDGRTGAIFMCVHQGNWEWASLACGFLGFGNVVVAENFKNARLTDVFRARREHSGQKLIPQENSLLRLLKVVKRGGATGMLIDLNLRPDQAATVIEAFGGLQMCVPLLHAVLSDRGGALLVPVQTQPHDDGRCRIIAHPPVEVRDGMTIRQIAQECWNAFEPIIRRQPEIYLWPYKHFRYRPRGTTRRYPAYSNESGKFEKLLRNTA
jgi:KDO2-lipid IV(A) lauroyltransferase